MAINLTESQVLTFAPNPAAAQNGRRLAEQGHLSDLGVDREQAVIWGNAAGSGKTPYACSADFQNPVQPVFRCSCPSRQFPCKHCLALLFAYVSGVSFVTGEVPGDLALKREKAKQRQERKPAGVAGGEDAAEGGEEKDQAGQAKPAVSKSKTASSSQTHKAKGNSGRAAQLKKIASQRAGLAKANDLLLAMVQAGLSTLDPKELATLGEQARDLGNYYIPGVQTAFEETLLAARSVQGEDYAGVIERLTCLAALLSKADAYLQEQAAEPPPLPAVDSAIEEQIGRVWKLAELSQLGLTENDASLLQLAFDVQDSPARREIIEEGVWFNLGSGRLYRTRNYRPYKALRHVRPENSFSAVALVPALYVYPGDLNPRIRWDGNLMQSRSLTSDDIARVRSAAAADYAGEVKRIRGVLKNPLAERHPYVLLALCKAWRNGGDLVLEDAAGTGLTIRNEPGRDLAAATLLGLFLPEDCQGLALLARVVNEVAAGLFTLAPMTLVTADRLVKLYY